MYQRLLPLAAAIALAPSAFADSSQAVTSGSAFNPQISLILDGSYYHDNQRGKGGEIVEESAGILHGHHFGEDEHGLENGFNLGESELVLSATVDPYLDAKFTGTFSGQGDVELEEAWLQTRMLPYGLKIKAGKFLSEIGYQNAQHKHAWDFSDQNLAYASLIGAEGFKDAGLQLTWLAPTPFYLLLGAEALEGSDQERFGSLVSEADASSVIAGSSPLPQQKSGPRIGTLFAKFGPDLGDSHALQLGLGYARAQQFQQVLDPNETALDGDELALDGHQQLYNANVVYKFDSVGEYGAGDLKVVAEYLRLKKDMDVSAAGASAALATGDSVSGTQDGYYVQATYGIAPRWTLGARYDETGATNTLRAGSGPTADFRQSSRSSLALSFYPSEFSRLRLQVADGDIADEAGNKTRLKQVLLGYNLSLGPHGAHQF